MKHRQPLPKSNPSIRSAAFPVAMISLALPALLVLLALVTVPPPAPIAAAAPQGPASTPPTTPTPAPTATANPAPGLCTVSGEQTAGATQIEIHRSLSLRLTLRASCPIDARGRADILLLFDNSTSMRDGGKIEAAKAAVLQFVNGVDFARHRVGLVPFADSAFVGQPLTFNRDYLVRALAATKDPSGSTNIAAALTLADNELQAAGRREAVPIIVLLTDGQSSAEPMRAAAKRAKDRGVTIFAIGLGDDAAQNELRTVASSTGHYYFAPGPAALGEIYTRIANMIREVMVTDVVVQDSLGRDVSYITGSGQPREPAALSSGRHPAWGVPFLTADDSFITYEVLIDRAGRVQPSETLWVDFADGDGSRRRVPIEPVAVDVIVPETHWIHLPILWKNQCIPSARYSDVALVLDNSSSMAGDKLAQAVAAAKRFVGLLDLRVDRAAVITFDAEGRLLQPLTGDRAALDRALSTLTTGAGTRLDRGLVLAHETLLNLTPPVGNRPVIVLLSDGRQSEAPARVYEAARNARAAGITIYTIGLGDDLDRGMLLAVSGSPARSFFTTRTEDLADIYAQIAGVVGCR